MPIDINKAKQALAELERERQEQQKRLNLAIEAKKRLVIKNAVQTQKSF